MRRVQGCLSMKRICHTHCAGNVDCVHGPTTCCTLAVQHTRSAAPADGWGHPAAAAFALHPGRTLSTPPPAVLQTWWLVRPQVLAKHGNVRSTLAAAGYPVQCVCVSASLVWVCSQPIVLLRTWLARAARRVWGGVLCYPAVCQEQGCRVTQQAMCGWVLLLCPVCIERPGVEQCMAYRPC